MSRKRLRPAYPPERLAAIYGKPRDHTTWRDHRLRVAVTGQIAAWAAQEHRARSAADLSCGDGAILQAVPVRERYFGDLAPGYGYDITGPIEETISRIPQVDLFICTETAEHLDDPDDVLARIRGTAHRMVLSTPIDAWNDTNPEHYWAWSRGGVEQMLDDAAWGVEAYAELDLRPLGLWYAYGIWVVV